MSGSGIGDLIATLAGGNFVYNRWASWELGGHTLTFDRVFRGLIELVALGVLTFLVFRTEREPQQR